MSDFLTNLVVRNLEPKTEIKPRLASLYEPHQPLGGILHGPIPSGPFAGPESSSDGDSQEVLEMEVNVFTAPASDNEPRQRHRAPSLEDQREMGHIRPLKQTLDASHAASRSPAQDFPAHPPSTFFSRASTEKPADWSNRMPIMPAPQSDGLTHPGPEKAQSRAEENRVFHEKPSPAPLLTQMQPPAPHDSMQARTRAREADDSQASGAREALDRRETSDTPRPTAVQAITPRVLNEETMMKGERDALAGVFFRPQVTRRGEADVERTTMSAPPEASPVINVTIGRIEVRASAASSQSKPGPQRQKPSSTSLDEYLRQRAQGGKR